MRVIAPLTLVRSSQRHNDTAPGVHDSLAKGNNVVQHLKVLRVLLSADACCLLQNLRDDREVAFKSAANSLSNIAKRLQNCRLELVAQSCALEEKENVSFCDTSKR
jgi:hypothetical protein